MPLYEYYDKKGDIVSRVVPVAERDKQDGMVRLSIPRVTVITSSAPSCIDMDHNVLKGYYEQEQKLGTRFRSSFTKEQIKQAWAT